MKIDFQGEVEVKINFLELQITQKDLRLEVEVPELRKSHLILSEVDMELILLSSEDMVEHRKDKNPQLILIILIVS